MTRFDLSRLHGDDPTYAPATFRAKRWLYWRAPKSYVELGHVKDAIRLPGEVGDGRDLERAAKARELTRELLRWRDGLDVPKVDPQSIRHGIYRYLHDPFSPFQSKKANTKAEYKPHFEYWAEKIGHMHMSDLNYEVIMRIKIAMEKNGASVDLINRRFNRLRIAISYLVSVEFPGALRVHTIFQPMRFKSPAPRQVAPTRDQVIALIAAADSLGERGLALGLELQWWLSMRMVDVYGQWLEKRWADGLTWDMVDLEALTITKVASKTRDKIQTPQRLDLSALPETVARLKAIPVDQRVGPVVRGKNGKPFEKRALGRLFDKVRAVAGVPDEIWLRDTRAGAITDGIQHGATLTQAQHAANHANPMTTNRYIRARDENAKTVIALRRKNE